MDPVLLDIRPKSHSLRTGPIVQNSQINSDSGWGANNDLLLVLMPNQ